jgi:Small, acid-soluble spore proteins, alpha/beta type.
MITAGSKRKAASIMLQKELFTVAKNKKSQSPQGKKSNTASTALSKFKMEAAREVDVSLKQAENSCPHKQGSGDGQMAKDAASRAKGTRS